VGVIKKNPFLIFRGEGDEKGISNTTLHSIARKEIDFNEKHEKQLFKNCLLITVD